MTDPVSSSKPPHHQAAPPSPNVSLLAREMQEWVAELAKQLEQVIDDPSLSTSSHFLGQFATNGIHLNQTVQNALLIR